jgi:hypothetical protein
MRLIGVRSLPECEEALTKCSQSSTADRTATVVPKPPPPRHSTKHAGARRRVPDRATLLNDTAASPARVSAGIDVAESAIKT